MASPTTEYDEPLTPTGRLFLQPNMDQVIHCVLGFENPLEVDAIKASIMNSYFLKHPRFRSLVIRDRSGVERWRKTDIELDRHVIVVESPVSFADDSAAANEYIADMTTGPGLCPDKPLWEIHFLMAHRCMVFRIHHALIDGVSLISMLMSACRIMEEPAAAGAVATRNNSRPEKGKGIMPLLKKAARMALLTSIFGWKSLTRMMCVSDHDTAITGGYGVELWPRKIATARFRLEDMEVVKKAVPRATINDVLVGVVSSGLAKYLDHRTPNEVPEGLQITGLAMVNLRKQPGLPDLSDLKKKKSQSRWGNKFGVMLLPIQYHKSNAHSNPLRHVKEVKAHIDQKKQSIEALATIKFINYFMSYLGSKIAGFINYRFVCNTSFTISNIVGPAMKVSLGDNPVNFMRVNTSSLPHSLVMHMVSYAGKAEMQLLVAKDIIPDPEFLANCFEEALLDMKRVAIG